MMRDQNRKRPNACKHGAFALIAILPGEDPREFERLHSALVEEWEPEGETENDAVLSLTKGVWRKRRVQKFVEAQVIKTTVDPSLPSFDETLGLIAFAGLMRDRPETAFEEHASRCPDKIKHLTWRVPRSKFGTTSEWAQAVVQEIYSVLLPESMITAPFASAAALSDDVFKKELALDERIDAMIDRAVKRLIQIKAMKQMLAQASIAYTRAKNSNGE